MSALIDGLLVWMASDEESCELFGHQVNRFLHENEDRLGRAAKECSLPRIAKLDETEFDAENKTPFAILMELQNRLWQLGGRLARLNREKRSLEGIEQRILIEERSRQRLNEAALRVQGRIATFSDGSEIEAIAVKQQDALLNGKALDCDVEESKEELQYWQEVFQLCRREVDVISESVSPNKSDIEAELEAIVRLEEQIQTSELPKLKAQRSLLDNDCWQLHEDSRVRDPQNAKGTLLKLLDAEIADQPSSTDTPSSAEALRNEEDGRMDIRQSGISSAYHAAKSEISSIESECVTLKKTVEELKKGLGDEDEDLPCVEQLDSIADVEAAVRSAKEKLRGRKNALAPLVQELKAKRQELRSLQDDQEKESQGISASTILSLEDKADALRKSTAARQEEIRRLEDRESMYRDLIKGIDATKLARSIEELKAEVERHEREARASKNVDLDQQEKWWKHVEQLLAVSIEASTPCETEGAVLEDATVLTLN